MSDSVTMKESWFLNGRKEMEESAGYKVKDVIRRKIKDMKGANCPEDLQKILQEVGVVSFSCRPQGLDWDVVRADALALRDRIGGMVTKA
jgi:hypothetical protein